MSIEITERNTIESNLYAAASNEWRPRVSVIIPTYNRGMLLVETIESLYQSTYPDWELIVVDQTPIMAEDVRNGLLRLNRQRPFIYVKLDKPSLTVARNAGSAPCKRRDSSLLRRRHFGESRLHRLPCATIREFAGRRGRWTHPQSDG